MKFLKKIPLEESAKQRVNFNFRITPLFRDDLDYARNSNNKNNQQKDYKNCSLIAKIFNIKGKIRDERLKEKEKTLNQTAQDFFEFLHQPEKFTSLGLQTLEDNLRKVTSLIHKCKKRRHLKEKNATHKKKQQ